MASLKDALQTPLQGGDIQLPEQTDIEPILDQEGPVAMPPPSKVDWKGFFSDRRFYALEPQEQMEAFQAMAQSDERVMALPQQEQAEFAQSMMSYFMPRRASVAEVEMSKMPFGEGVPRAAADPLVQPEMAMAVKGYADFAEENPEVIDLQKRMAGAESAVPDMISKIMSTPAGEAILKTQPMLAGAAQLMGGVSDVPFAGEAVRKFTETLGPMLGKASVGALGTAGDVPMALAEHLTPKNSRMKARWGEWRDAWGKIIEHGMENALVFESANKGMIDSLMGKSELDAANAQLNQPSPGNFIDGVMQGIERWRDPWAKGDFSRLVDQIGSDFGNIAATAGPSVGMYAVGGPIAAFALSHAYLTGESLSDATMRGVAGEMSPAELAVYQLPGAMLDTLGAKGILKGIKPGKISKTRTFLSNRAVALANATTVETATEVTQQAGNIMIRRAAEGKDIDPRTWGPEEGAELAETFMSTLFGTAAMTGGGQVASLAVGKYAPVQAEIEAAQENVAKAKQDMETPELAGAEGRVVTAPAPAYSPAEIRFEVGQERLDETLDENELNAWIKGEPINVQRVVDRTGIPRVEVEARLKDAEATAARLGARGVVRETVETPVGEASAASASEFYLSKAAEFEAAGNKNRAAQYRRIAKNVRPVKATTEAERSIGPAFKKYFGLDVDFIETPGVGGAHKVQGVFFSPGRVTVNVSTEAQAGNNIPGAFALVAAASHEATHNLERVNPQAYSEYLELLKTDFSSEWEESRSMLEESQGETINDSEIAASVAQLPGVANDIVKAMANRAAVEEKAKSPSQLSQWFTALVDKLDKALGGRLTKIFGERGAKAAERSRAQLALRLFDALEQGREPSLAAAQETTTPSPAPVEVAAAVEGVKEPEEQAEASAEPVDSTTVESPKAAKPSDFTAASVADGGRFTVTAENGQTIDVIREDDHYVVEVKARSGKVLRRSRRSNVRQVKAALKTLMADPRAAKYSVSFPEFRQAVSGGPAASATIIEDSIMRSLEKALRSNDPAAVQRASREISRFDKDVKILEKSDFNRDMRFVHDAGSKLGIKVFYYTGPPSFGTIASAITPGFIFINTTRARGERYRNLVSVLVHEALHIMRRSKGADFEAWKKLRDLFKSNAYAGEWAAISKKVRGTYGADWIGRGYKPGQILGSLENEIVSYMAQEYTGFFVKAMEQIYADAPAESGFWAKLGKLAEKMGEFVPAELSEDVASSGDPAQVAGKAIADTLANAARDLKGAVRYDAADAKKVFDQFVVPNSITGEVVGSKSGNTSVHPQFSVTTLPLWETKYRETLSEAGADKATIDRHIKDLRFAAMVMSQRPDLMPDPDIEGLATKDIGPLRENIDYIRTVDFDTECIKNIAWNAYRRMVEKAMGRPLGPIEKVAFARHLKAKGITVPCGYCYVETNRELLIGGALKALHAVELIQAAPKNMSVEKLARYAFEIPKKGKVSELKARMAEMWQKNDIPVDTSPRLLVDEEYREKAVKLDPRVEVLYKQILEYQAGFNAKARQGYFPYTSEIFQLKQSDIDTINGRAGLRFFSNTDFKVDHAVDLMQLVADAQARGLKGHAYTKVPAFAEIFGNTGMKIGLSLFAKGGLDGKPIQPDLVEGADWNEAKRLRKKFKDVGTVMVVTNDAQLEYALDQDWVDLIIPWHSSMLNLDIGVGLEGWKNYTGDQHDRGKPGGGNYKFSDHGNSLEKLKKLAKRDGAQLRFHRVILPKSGIRATEHPGYMKLVTDNVRTDSEHEVMRPEFDMDAFERLATKWQNEDGHEKLLRPDPKTSKQLIDSFIKDVLPNADEMAAAAAEMREQNKKQQDREAGQARKTVEFLEKTDAKVDRVNVPEIPESHVAALAERAVIKAAAITKPDGVALFKGGVSEPLVRKYFTEVKRTKSGFTARGPVQFSVVGPDAKMSAQKTVADPVFALPEMTRWERFRKEMQDSFLRFKALRSMMDNLGLPYSEGMDVYLMEEAYHGRSANQLRKIDMQYVQPVLNGLRKITDESGETVEEIFRLFDLYLHARHASERNKHLESIWVDNAIQHYQDKTKVYESRLKELYQELDQWVSDKRHEQRVNDEITRVKARLEATQNSLGELQEKKDSGNIPNSGMTEEKRKAVFKMLKDKGLDKKFKPLAKHVDEMLNYRLDALLQSGMITQESYDNVKNWYQYYVPLKALDKNLPGDVEQLFEMAGNWATRAFDIRGDELRQSLGFEPDKRVEVSPVFTQAVMDTMAALDRIERNRVGQALLRLVEAYPNPQLWEVNKVVKKKIYDKRAGRARHVDDYWAKEDPNVVSVKRDGKEVFIHLYDANLASAMNGLGVENIHAFFRGLRGALRVMAQLYTSLSPDFIISNFTRDWQQARVSLTTDMSDEMAKKVSREAPKAIRAIMHVNFPNRVKLPKDPRTKQLVDYYQEQKEAGGTVGFFGLRNIEDLQRKLVKELKITGDQPIWKTARGLEKLMEVVMRANEATENGIRLATYAAARDMGLSKDKAASLAKNVTVNFNRHGDKGGLIGGFYLFFNAGAQGIQRTAQSFSTPVGRKLAAKFFFIGMATSILARALMGEDDDGEDKYDKISEYERSRHWIIPLIRGGYLKIPLPYGYGFFAHAGIEAANVLTSLDPTDKRGLLEAASSSAVRMVAGATTHFSPIGEAHINQGWYALVSPLIPSLAAPFADALANETYWGTPVYPEASPWDRRADSWRTWRERGLTDKIFNRSFQYMNKLFGGSKFRSSTELTDINPEIVQYLLGSYAGPSLQTFPRLIKTASMLGGGREFTANDVPVLRRFLGQLMPEYYIPSAYYDAVNDVMSAKEERRWFDEEGISPWRWQERHGWKLSLVSEAQRSMNRINELRKEGRDDEALRLQKEFIIRYSRSEP